MSDDLIISYPPANALTEADLGSTLRSRNAARSDDGRSVKCATLRSRISTPSAPASGDTEMTSDS